MRKKGANAVMQEATPNVMEFTKMVTTNMGLNINQVDR